MCPSLFYDMSYKNLEPNTRLQQYTWIPLLNKRWKKKKNSQNWTAVSQHLKSCRHSLLCKEENAELLDMWFSL